MQKKAIRCNDPKGRRGVLVQTTKPTTDPTDNTTQRPAVQAPCRGTFAPAQRKVIISRTKKRWSNFHTLAMMISSSNIPPRKETLPKYCKWAYIKYNPKLKASAIPTQCSGFKEFIEPPSRLKLRPQPNPQHILPVSAFEFVPSCERSSVASLQ